MSGEKRTYVSLIPINGGLMRQKVTLSDLLTPGNMEKEPILQPMPKVSEKRIRMIIKYLSFYDYNDFK